MASRTGVVNDVQVGAGVGSSLFFWFVLFGFLFFPCFFKQYFSFFLFFVLFGFRFFFVFFHHFLNRFFVVVLVF